MEIREISKEFVSFIIKLKKFARVELDKSQKKNCDNPMITMQQFRTMIVLKNAQKCALKDLSAKTHVSTSSLCIMLNKLCNDELAYREIDPNDRRNTFYSLTSKGIEVLDNELENKLSGLDKIINKLNKEKREILYKCIIEIEDIVDELSNK